MSKTRKLIQILAVCIFVPMACAQILIPVPIESRNWVSVTKDLAAPIFYLATIIIAIIGLFKWKKELRGRTRYEIAIDVIVGAYRIRDAINGRAFDRHYATFMGNLSEPKEEEFDGQDIQSQMKNIKT
jgi:hypothetical protein